MTDAIARLNSVVEEMNARFVAREEDLSLRARSIVAGYDSVIVSVAPRLDSAPAIP